VNADGEVIGINSSIYTPNQGSVGLGFAIPINNAKRVIESLKKRGKVEHNTWTGFYVQSLDETTAQYYRFNSTEGVIVTDVDPKSPASKANIQPEDIIIEANGAKIRNQDDWYSILLQANAGDELELKIVRDGGAISRKVKLAQHP
jgi:serine protease Do